MCVHAVHAIIEQVYSGVIAYTRKLGTLPDPHPSLYAPLH